MPWLKDRFNGWKHKTEWKREGTVVVMSKVTMDLSVRPTVSVTVPDTVDLHPSVYYYKKGHRTVTLVGVTRNGKAVVQLKGTDELKVLDGRSLIVNIGTRVWLHGQPKRDKSEW